MLLKKKDFNKIIIQKILCKLKMYMFISYNYYYYYVFFKKQEIGLNRDFSKFYIIYKL